MLCTNSEGLLILNHYSEGSLILVADEYSFGGFDLNPNKKLHEQRCPYEIKEQKTTHDLFRSVPKSSTWPKATELDFLYPQCETRNVQIRLNFDNRVPHCGMRKS